MKKFAIINPDLCAKEKGCPAVRGCPVGALTQDKANTAPMVHHNVCIGCNRCVMTCSQGALSMQKNSALPTERRTEE